MKKRVLQFIGSFNQGGTERQAVALARMLHQEGSFDVFAATLNSDGVLRDEAELIGLPAIPEFPLTSFFDPNFVRQTRLASRYLVENHIDLVHTHDFYTNVFGMAAAALAGVKVRVASKRETFGMRSPGQDMVEKMAYRSAERIVVNAECVRDQLKQRGIPDEKIQVIYNGVDVERFARSAAGMDLRQLTGIRPDIECQFVTLVANLRHQVKNIPLFLRAAANVLTKVPTGQFVIAGEGELEKELHALARDLGVDANTHFVGRVTDIPAILESSDVCVLTSTAEGFSNSILEYMAAGKPVVATDVGGAREVIANGQTGYLIGSDDTAALTERIIELLSEPQRMQAFGKAGRELVAQKFSSHVQLDNTLTLYRALLD